MPILETFANCPSCVASGSSGTTAPSALTSEGWTMGTGFATFPLAQSTAQPNNVFYIRDPADATNEIVEVTAGGGGTASWTVTRGVGGTTPVAHATGATWVQEISHVGLDNFDQYQGASSDVTVANTTNETALGLYTPTTAELVAGAIFKFTAFGTMGTTTSTQAASFTWRWGYVSSASPGTLITNIATTTTMPVLPASMSGVPFIVEADLRIVSTSSAHANVLWTRRDTAAGAGATYFNCNATPTTGLTGLGPIALTWKWGTAIAANTITFRNPLLTRIS